jgi:hypothetical protein
MDHMLPPGCYTLLHIETGPSHDEEKGRPPLIVTERASRFTLNNDIWIERLDEQLAKNIQKACEPPHYNIHGVEHDRHLYAFVRRFPEIEKSNYEGMAELFGAITLSRLIHPTSIGDRYCAKVFHFGLQDSAIQAIQYRGMSPDVFLGDSRRDWLSLEDGEDLRRLVPWLSKDKCMHGRVHRAYWNHEYAMRSYYLDARWILVVSGLEALISTGGKDSSWQFRDRLRQLAAGLKIDLNDDDLKLAYKLRSKLVHAESFLFNLETILPKSEHSVLYQKLEALLRMTIRRCLLDEGFGSFFRDDAAVEVHWQLNPKTKK